VPFMKVPLDDLTSLIQTFQFICIVNRKNSFICKLDELGNVTKPTCPFSNQISACVLERTLESKIPFVASGGFLALTLRPILMGSVVLSLLRSRRLVVKVPFLGSRMRLFYLVRRCITVKGGGKRKRERKREIYI
jgi:hypothetical protein